MTELAHHETDYSVLEREPPEVMARALRVGAHLWSSATAFFFLAFLFAYFYLRSLNNHGQWHPHHVKAPVDTRNADRRLSGRKRRCRRPWHASPPRRRRSCLQARRAGRADTRAARRRAADRRVRHDRFRSDRRWVCERVPRLDGPLPALRDRRASTGSRRSSPRPFAIEVQALRVTSRERRRATATVPATTSPSRSRWSSPVRKRSRSTGRCWRGSGPSPG